MAIPRCSVILHFGIWKVSMWQIIKSLSRMVYRGFFCLFLVPFWRMVICICCWLTLSRRKIISLSLPSISILESRFKLRLRALPENLEARIAALMMSATAELMISILFVIIWVWSLIEWWKLSINCGIITFYGGKCQMWLQNANPYFSVGYVCFWGVPLSLD